MNRKSNWILIIAIFLLFTLPGMSADQPLLNPAAKAVADADRAFCAATRAKGLDGWMEWFSDKAVLPQFEPPAIGKDGIRKAYVGFFAAKDLDFKWEPDVAQILPQGEIAYTSGHYTRSWTDAKGAKQSRSGNYVTVWEKQKDGSWLVIFDGGSSNPPPKK